jgi:hypothetical protein
MARRKNFAVSKSAYRKFAKRLEVGDKFVGMDRSGIIVGFDNDSNYVVAVDYKHDSKFKYLKKDIIQVTHFKTGKKDFLPYTYLDRKEHSYLYGVIRPWWNKVENIKKVRSGKNSELISIKLYGRKRPINLCEFPAGTKYIFMKRERPYGVFELGLYPKDYYLVSFENKHELRKAITDSFGMVADTYDAGKTASNPVCKDVSFVDAKPVPTTTTVPHSITKTLDAIKK